ncbi:hypothetical protein HPB52_009172 [Rhipicephalus sanguineus]|uniref:Peptidase M13 N-terminal domain-containing protein n=1 Tax=Rhipicephalus sanguineus TaxID=34632 RepID=A0A9D4PI09_RHISA|nr:hypothetical protein HPB52_009172 [Rhipicephalus sanguineus]
MSRSPEYTHDAHREKRSPSAKSRHRGKKGKGDGSPRRSHSSRRSKKRRSRSKSRKSRSKKFGGDDSLSPAASSEVSSGSRKSRRRKSRKRHKPRSSRGSKRSREGRSRIKSKEGCDKTGGGDLVGRGSKSPDQKSPEGTITVEKRSKSRASKRSGSRRGKSRKRHGKGRRKDKSRSKSSRKSRSSGRSPEVSGSPKRSQESVSPERRSETRASKGSKRSGRSRSRDGRKSGSRSSRKSKSSRHSRRKHGRHSRHGRRRKRRKGKRRGESRSPRSSGRRSRSRAKRRRRRKHGKRHRTSRKRSHSTRASRERRLHGAKKATEQVGYAGGYTCFCLALAIFAILVLIVCALAAYYACVIKSKSNATSTATSEGTGHTGSSRSTRKHRTRRTPRSTTKPLEPYYCTSGYCKREGQYIGALLSATTSPCDDFYEHVCATWVSQHPERSTFTGSLVSQDTMIQMALTRHLLDQLKGAGSGPDVGVAAELHSDCIDRIGSIPPAVDSLGSLFAKWSIVSWPRGDTLHGGEVAVWRFAAELARDLDLATIARVGVSVNPDNLDETVVTLEMPRFLLSEADPAKGDAAELFKRAVGEVVGELKASVAGDFAQRLFTVRSAFAIVKTPSRNGEDELVVRFGKLSEGLREFLTVLLSNVPRRLTSETNILLRSAAYFQRDVHGVLRSFPLEDTVNYFGFLVIVRLAPFLSHDMRSLRNLFADSVLGHTVGDVAADTPLLCAWLVDRVLPDCVAKAIGRWRHSAGRDVVTREWLDQLEMVFLKHVTDLPWIGELSALLVRYRLKRRATIQVGPSTKLDCARGLRPTGSNPLLVFWNVSKQRQDKTLRGLLMRGDRLRNRVWASGRTDLSVEASFRRDFQLVHVPAALFNDSVPTGSSIFVFHLARVAVRFYRALAQFLHENPYEREAPLSFTQDYGHQLADILDCLRERALDSGALLSARELLDRTTALLMAVNAFDRLLPIRRIWRLDLRLKELPDVTAHQLFFIYFALDNCESRDPAFHHGRLSAKQAVNVPLKHLSQFAEAFKCRTGAPMAGLDCMLDFRRRRSAAEVTWNDQESDHDVAETSGPS